MSSKRLDESNPSDARTHSKATGIQYGLLAAGLGIAGLSAMVITGWVAPYPLLVTGLRAGFPTVLNAALCFGLCAIALVSAAFGWMLITRIVGLVISVFCLATVFEYISGRSLGIDDFWSQQIAKVTSSSRIGPSALFGFLLISLALILLSDRKRSQGPRILILVGALLVTALFCILGYAVGVRVSTYLPNPLGASLPTAVGFLVIAVALASTARDILAERRLVLPLAVGAFVCLAASGMVAVQNNRALIKANRWVEHTFEVRDRAGTFLMVLSDLDADERKYYLSGEGELEKTIGRREDEIQRAADMLGLLVADNPSQTARIVQLQKAIQDKLVPLKRTIEEHRREGDGEQSRLEHLRETSDRSTSVKAIVTEIMVTEKGLLDLRRGDSATHARQTEQLVWMGGLLAGLMVAASSWLARSAEQSRCEAETALQEANGALEKRADARARELHEATSRLTASEQSFKLLADAVPQIIWTATANGAPDYYNQRWYDYLGLNSEHGKDVSWEAILHPDDVALRVNCWTRALAAGTHYEGEYRLKHGASGTYRWHLSRAFPQRTEDGRIVRWVGTSTDIHDQKHQASLLEDLVEARTKQLEATRLELQTTARMQQAILDGTNLGIISTTTDGVIQTVNSGAETMLGYKRSELVGRRKLEILHEPAEIKARASELSREFGCPIAPGFEVLVGPSRNGKVFEREWTQVHKTGRQIPVLLSISALHDADGKISGFLGVSIDLTERKELEAKLRKVSERVPGMVYQFLLRPDGSSCFPYSSEAIRQIYRVSPEEVREDANKVFETIHPDDINRVVESIFESARTLSAWDCEYRTRFRDGVVRWLQANSVPERLGDGTIVWHGFISDITDRKKIDDNLRQNEERLRLATRAAGVAVWDWDLKLNRVTWDPAMFALYGLTPSANGTITTEAWHAHIHPYDLAAQKEILGRTVTEQGEGRRIFRIIRACDQVERLIEAEETVIAGPDGHAIRMVGVNVDVTDRENTEHALRLSEERYRTLNRHAPVGIFQADANGYCTYVNERWSELTGLNLTQALGHGWRVALNAEDRMRVLRDWVTFTRGGKAFESEFRMVKKGKPLAWVAGGAIPLRNATGEITGYIGTLTDITERKELEINLAQARDQALEASRLKSEFIATMSHEIRTPMNGVIGMSGLLMNTTLTAEQREMGQVIIRSAEGLNTIINDILDFSKIEAGKLRIEATDINLMELVEETVALLAPQAHRKQLELICDIEPIFSSGLRGDGTRIQQIVTNLLGNAIKFTPQGEVSLLVRVKQETPQNLSFRVEVKDSGIGIPLDVQGRLFQPFTQADGSTTRRFGGTGLGLAICRRIVSHMGGQIDFESREGAGSSFWFDLALPRVELPKTVSAQNLPPGTRVLVVDHSETNRRIVLAQLQAMGALAEAVETGRKALEILGKNEADGTPFGILILDWHIPEMDGLDLARQVRRDPRFSETSLVMLASTTPLEATNPESEIVLDAMLTKPVREIQLRRTLLRIIGRPATAAPFPTTAPEAKQGLSLLVVEDNTSNQLVARLTLEHMGHHIEVAENGLLALESLERGKFDAILMDCQMPVLDGYETTRRIRAGEVKGLDPRIPVIALTAYAMSGDRARCLSAGMDDYVTKPLSPHDLREAFLRCGLGDKVKEVIKPAELVAVPPKNDEPVLDEAQWTMLKTMRMPAGNTLADELLVIFTGEMPGRMSSLTTLVNERRAGEVAGLAHKIAGSCASLGASAMRSAALGLEKAGREQAWTEIPAKMSTLETEFERLERELSLPKI